MSTTNRASQGKPAQSKLRVHPAVADVAESIASDIEPVPQMTESEERFVRTLLRDMIARDAARLRAQNDAPEGVPTSTAA